MQLPAWLRQGMTSAPDAASRTERADNPADISARGWRELAVNALRATLAHEVPSTAAAAAFYAVLSFVPAVAAFGSAYGLFASPDKLRQRLDGFSGLVPAGVLDLIRAVAVRFAHGEPGRLVTATAIFGLVALATASSSVGALLAGLNTAYRQKEERRRLHLRLLGLGFAAGIAAALSAEVVLVIRTSDTIWASRPGLALIELAVRWSLLFAAMMLCLALLYRYGPDRRRARWRWVTPGSAAAAVAALGTSAGVSLYLSRVAHYEHIYGALGSLLGLMIWVWCVMIVVLAGAELNWAIECKTAADTSSRPGAAE